VRPRNCGCKPNPALLRAVATIVGWPGLGVTAVAAAAELGREAAEAVIRRRESNKIKQRIVIS
jgi:hypothetical protein